MAEFEHLQLRADAEALVGARHAAQKVRRRTVQLLIEVERTAVEAADFRHQLEYVSDPFLRAHEIGARAQRQGLLLRTKQDISAHASGQVQDHTAVLAPDSLHDLAKKRGIAARQAGLRIADMQMDDGRPGGMRLERRGGDLRRRHGHMRILAHRIRRAGHGTGDENLRCQHSAPPRRSRYHSVQSSFTERSCQA